MPESNTFLDECIAEILRFSGPFRLMTEEAAAEIDEFLKAETDGKTKEELCQNPTFKSAFWDRLALVGRYAADNGTARMREAAGMGMSTKRLVSLHGVDIKSARDLVVKISFTRYCIPVAKP